MIGPLGNQLILRFSRNKILCFPQDQSLKCSPKLNASGRNFGAFPYHLTKKSILSLTGKWNTPPPPADGALKGSLGGGVPTRPWPWACLRQNPFISLPCLRLDTVIFCLCSAFFVCLVFHFFTKYFFVTDIIELDIKQLLEPTCWVQGSQFRRKPCSRC